VSRADRVTGRLAERGADLLLVTNLVNIGYLTGFTGSSAMVVLGPETRRFITDFRYVERAKAEVSDFDLERAPQEFAEALKTGWPEGPVRLGFEDQHLSVRQHKRLRELLPERIELVPAGGVVEAERALKEPGEVEKIRAAAALADEIYDWVRERGLVGRTEREVALALEEEMRRRGASGPSFDSIVASAEHGALPHAEPRDVEIPAGTLVTIDWGAQLDGYASDCTRTYATGELDPRDREIYDLVLRAQEESLAAVRAGAGGREVDAVARDIITAAGHGEHFGHGLGHGVGAEVHEGPRLSQRSEATLETGQVVTVEPGVYVPGAVGVRIEDLAIVTAEGAEVLTGLPKDLQIIE
jgi:Xaa-Pro aminopeptidase